MRERHSTRFDAENDFVLSSHILAELRKELKSEMRLKTASTHKEVNYGETQRNEEQMQSLLKNLKTYVSPFHVAAGSYGNSSGGVRKNCEWATFLKRKR